MRGQPGRLIMIAYSQEEAPSRSIEPTENKAFVVGDIIFPSFVPPLAPSLCCVYSGLPSDVGTFTSVPYINCSYSVILFHQSQYLLFFVSSLTFPLIQESLVICFNRFFFQFQCFLLVMIMRHFLRVCCSNQKVNKNDGKSDERSVFLYICIQNKNIGKIGLKETDSQTQP